jgi:hypothetical protein
VRIHKRPSKVELRLVYAIWIDKSCERAFEAPPAATGVQAVRQVGPIKRSQIVKVQ